MSESNESTCSQPGEFSWNELVTTDVAGAKAFYTGLFGWTTTPFGDSYVIFKKGDASIGGMMQAPAPGIPAQWVPYVTVDDVDATAAQVQGLGGKVMAPPFDVPDIGRIAVILDPQGAAFGLFKPKPLV